LKRVAAGCRLTSSWTETTRTSPGTASARREKTLRPLTSATDALSTCAGAEPALAIHDAALGRAARASGFAVIGI
jgi:hypothetical protein